METSRSVLELMRRAYALGQRVWPDYDSPFGRHDFTRPQLFACLAVGELQRSQSVTVNSMMKRNLGEYLRSVLTRRRKREMLLKSLLHNLMLGPHSKRERKRG